MCVRAQALVRVRVMVGFACLLTLSFASPAQADDPQDPAAAQARTQTAEMRHRAGVAAFAKGHYRDAIDLFLEADRLQPSAALSFNVARCYEQLHDVSNELAWYRDYLRRSNGSNDSEQVARIIARLEERLAQKGVQQVTIDSSPGGATVLIDGTPVGVSPWTGDLAPGGHAVELTLRGFEDLSQHFDLPRDHALDIELALAHARSVAEAQQPAVSGSRPVAEAPVVPLPTIAHASQPKADAGSMSTTVGWMVLATGGATLGGALVLELLRRGAQKDAEHEPRQIQFAQDLKRMRSLQTVARVLGGVGVTLAVVGGTLLVVGAEEGEHATSTKVALSCAPSRCRASLTGTF
jgi:tetratricopeptide (TPR) repeat protein